MSNESVLEVFGKDITKLAENDLLDAVIGRDDEMKRIATILSRRKKNNPLLIGEPGVGKTAIIEGLAIRIAKKLVPRTLFNKRIISIDMASVVAGTKYRGQFEERMKMIIDELEKDRNIIIFIDEIHTIVGAGNSSGSLDASNILKPSLSKGMIQCIGSTTLNEYKKNIEKDGALDRRFQKIIIESPSEEQSIDILNNIKDKYEDYHLVKYSDKSIESCVRLSNRYIPDKNLPDKAIDIMDEVGSLVHINNIKVPKSILDIEKNIEKIKNKKTKFINNQEFEEAAECRDKEKELKDKLDYIRMDWEKNSSINRIEINEEQVADLISTITGIPITRIVEKESEKLLKMDSELNEIVIGQKEAIDNITKSIRRNRAGIKDPKKPIGSFIFLGSTGIGKTYLTKVLAKYLFNSEDSLIRLDMSEYMEKHSVSKLIGSPPGYVGYEDGGQLTEKIKRKPYSVVLFDEIEKAHPDIQNVLLQILDDGQLTDSFGRKVDFKNTIIIMTSNIGSRKIKDFGDGIGFNTKSRINDIDKNQKSIIENSLKNHFSPEFINRLDDIIIFNSLKKEDIEKIVNIELINISNRIEKFKIKYTDNFKNYIIENGFDSDYGARYLKRFIQKNVEDPISEEIIKCQNLDNVDTINMDYDNEIKNVKTNIILKKKKSKKINLKEINLS